MFKTCGILRQERNLRHSAMFKALFYPRKKTFYTDNGRASLTNSMSAVGTESLKKHLIQLPFDSYLNLNLKEKVSHTK